MRLGFIALLYRVPQLAFELEIVMKAIYKFQNIKFRLPILAAESTGQLNVRLQPAVAVFAIVAVCERIRVDYFVARFSQ